MKIFRLFYFLSIPSFEFDLTKILLTKIKLNIFPFFFCGKLQTEGYSNNLITMTILIEDENTSKR
jgi:hypothetical protein